MLSFHIDLTFGNTQIDTVDHLKMGIETCTVQNGRSSTTTKSSGEIKPLSTRIKHSTRD